MMAKTNLDDLDLEQPGIESDEINSESATAGQVLTADGSGGSDFSDAALQVGAEDNLRSSNAHAFNTGEEDVTGHHDRRVGQRRRQRGCCYRLQLSGEGHGGAG